MKPYLLLVFLQITVSLCSYGQSDCESLLKWGIYNKITKTMSSSEFRTRVNSFCNLYSSEGYTQKTVDAAASAFGIGASASYTQTEIQRLHTLNCGTSIDVASVESNSSFYYQFVDPEIVRSFVECKKLESDKLKFEIRPVNNEYEIVTVSVRDETPPPQLQNELKSIIVSGAPVLIDNVKSKTGNNLSSAIKLRDGNASFTFTRIREQTGNIVYKSSQIAFKLTLKTFTLNMPEVKGTELLVPGVGEIVTSTLAEGEFKKLYDIPGRVEWVLADGRPCIGTDYAKLVNDSIPDLRGVFLRGKNYDRKANDGSAFSKNEQIGKYSSDATRNPGFAIGPVGDHAHGGFDVFIQDPAFPGTNFIDNQDWSGIARADAPQTITQKGNTHLAFNTVPSGGHTHPLQGGDSETSPKSVTVNYFICINSHK